MYHGNFRLFEKRHMRRVRHLTVRSRNVSCRPLRELEVPVRTLYRMGSATPIERIFRSPLRYLEINTVHGCLVSGDKIKMKKAFNECGVHTAEWFIAHNRVDAKGKVQRWLPTWGVIIAKRLNSSGGRGIYLIQSVGDLDQIHDDITKYIFERYYNYTKEYRVHVSKFGCFYTSRKMLRNTATVRWHRHSENSVFINEENPMFDKPTNWDEIVADCIKALEHMQLDIAAFDVKCTRDGRFILLESNSAPALGEQGIEKYKNELKKIINDKLR